jgi:hypothetical protein
MTPDPIAPAFIPVSRHVARPTRDAQESVLAAAAAAGPGVIEIAEI